MVVSKAKQELYADPTIAKFLPVRTWTSDDGVYCEDWYIHERGLQGELLTITDGPKKLLSSSAKELDDALGALILDDLEEAYRVMRRFCMRWMWERFVLDVPPFVLYQYPGTTRRPFAVLLLQCLLNRLEDIYYPQAPEPLPILDELVIVDVQAMLAQNKAQLSGITNAARNQYWLDREYFRKTYNYLWAEARDIACPPPRF